MVEQHGFADSSQAHEHMMLRWSPAPQTIKRNVDFFDDFRTAEQFVRRRCACTGGVGVVTTIHI
jgi:hypothetical protein